MTKRARVLVGAVAIGGAALSGTAVTASAAQAAPADQFRHDTFGSLSICIGPPLVVPVPGTKNKITISLCF